MFQTAFLDLPPLQSAHGELRLPGSKSISNRVLLLAALSEGTTQLEDLLDSDDTRVMLAALQQLGCKIEHQGTSLALSGLGAKLPTEEQQLFLGNAGTAMRPLCAALAVRGGNYQLSGVARMHERPIGDLVDALRAIGCQIDYLAQPGFPPLGIRPGRLRLDKPVPVRGDVSSQFLTALLLALPLAAAQQEVVIEVVGELISKPYVAITLKLLERFGVQVQHQDWQRFVIPRGARYQSPGQLYVEADASSASYFLGLGAIAAHQAPTGEPAQITVLGLGAQSIQGDIAFADTLRALGAQVELAPNSIRVRRGAWPLKAFDLDCNHIPDAAMTLAVLALYANGPCRLRNIGSWRVKETDRIAAMAQECAKLGASVEQGPDWLRITAPQRWRAASIHTYDDHRVAMCFSLAAYNPARLPVRIQDPACVAKTFPDYFETLFSVAGAKPGDIPVLCVDGPTASGKGTLGAALAQRLGYHYLDSGALYRALALAARRAGLSLEADQAPQALASLVALAEQLPIRFVGDQVWLANDDISAELRSEACGMDASKVSALAPVRAALLDLQYRFRRLPGLVADGRDMGSVVFPDAKLKVFLSASAATRAQRRYKQLISKGISANIDSLRADLEARDARDSQRAVAPLVPAQDALLLDNSALTVEQSVQQVLLWWQNKQAFDKN